MPAAVLEHRVDDCLCPKGTSDPHLEREQVLGCIFSCFDTGALASQAAQHFSDCNWADVSSVFVERVERGPGQEGDHAGWNAARKQSV